MKAPKVKRKKPRRIWAVECQGELDTSNCSASRSAMLGDLEWHQAHDEKGKPKARLITFEEVSRGR